MIEPTSKDIGRRVVYTGNRYPGGKPEEGVITSFNAVTVFVRYSPSSDGIGTSRQDLEWLKPAAAQCRPTEQEQDASYRAAMRDAGRGRLLS